ncbi:hypothetical protein KAS31_00505 [Candidatus Parcubacteria bacterium]|nr:hypothetical protein [Candidatus Parcubacteria bacterium]
MVTKKIKKKENIKPKTKAKKTTKAVKKSPTKKTVQKKASNKTKRKVSSKTSVVKKVIKKKKKKMEESSYFAEWVSPEHIRTKQDMIIYYASAVLSVFAIIWFYFQGSFIVVMTFLALLFVTILYIYQEPRDVEIKIDLDGIIFGSMIYKYIDIESFEVVEGEYFNVLKFKLKNSILPVKEIQIVDQDSRYIRAVLEYFLPEERQNETLFGFEKKNDLDEYLSEEDVNSYLEEKEKLRRLEERQADKT